jgi:hypothetical protein
MEWALAMEIDKLRKRKSFLTGVLFVLLALPLRMSAQCTAPSGWTHSFWIGSLSPNTKPAGSAGFTMKICGANLSGYAGVRWNGVAISSGYIHHVSQQEIDVSIQPIQVATVGVFQVVVVEPGTVLTNVLNFTVTSSAPVPPPPTPGPLTIVTTGLATTSCVIGTTTTTCYKLPQAIVGQSYRYQIQVTGGVPPYTFSILTVAQLVPQGYMVAELRKLLPKWTLRSY